MIVEVQTNTKFEIIHELINKGGNLMSIKSLCKIAGVSRSGYYAWEESTPKRQERDNQDRADFDEIYKAFRFKGYDKGARGIYMRLLRHNPPIVMNLKKIRRLMRKFNLECPIRKADPYAKMLKALRENNYVKNILNRNFKGDVPRSVLLTDITYLKRKDGKFSYLSVIMDAHTKEILAHAVSSSLKIDFVLETVNLLIKNHGKELKTNVIFHSDQGSHYTSHKLVKLLKDSKLRRSMSRKANCWDNAPQESLFGHMKEEIDISKCITNKDIKKVIDNWVDYYNNYRYQWDLNKLSPREYYEYVVNGIDPLKRKKV